MSELDQILHEDERQRKHDEWFRKFEIAPFPGEESPMGGGAVDKYCPKRKLYLLDNQTCDYSDLILEFLKRLGYRKWEFSSRRLILTCPNGAEHLVAESETAERYERVRNGLTVYPKVKIHGKYQKIPKAMVRFKSGEDARVNDDIRKHGVSVVRLAFDIRVDTDRGSSTCQLSLIDKKVNCSGKAIPAGHTKISRREFAETAARILKGSP